MWLCTKGHNTCHNTDIPAHDDAQANKPVMAAPTVCTQPSQYLEQSMALRAQGWCTGAEWQRGNKESVFNGNGGSEPQDGNNPADGWWL